MTTPGSGQDETDDAETVGGAGAAGALDGAGALDAAERDAVGLVERRALRASMVVSLLLSGASVTLGIATKSQVILFDGMYGVLGIGLTWVSMVASQLVSEAPTAKYPFGRAALAPMVIALQGVALLAACAYAVIDALLAIVHGGDSVAAGLALIYGIVSAAAVFGFWLWLRRPARRSEILHAEANQWLASAALGLAVVVAFALVLVLRHAGAHGAARYVDPATVLICCAALVPVPVRMLRATMVELLEGAPDPDVQRPVRVAVRRVSALQGLPEPYLRMAKLGPKLYLDAEFVVEDEGLTVADADRVRRALLAALADQPYEIWLNVELSHDPELVI